MITNAFPSLTRGEAEDDMGTFDSAAMNARFSVSPRSRNRRTYWVTPPGSPICRRASSHPFDTDVVIFMFAASAGA
jgi:hypothetical protein